MANQRQNDSENQNRNQSQNNETGKRGFASMDDDSQREIARMGGRAAQEQGTAHEFSSEEARQAGRKGGQGQSGERSNKKSA